MNPAGTSCSESSRPAGLARGSPSLQVAASPPTTSASVRTSSVFKCAHSYERGVGGSGKGGRLYARVHNLPLDYFLQDSGPGVRKRLGGRRRWFKTQTVSTTYLPRPHTSAGNLWPGAGTTVRRDRRGGNILPQIPLTKQRVIRLTSVMFISVTLCRNHHFCESSSALLRTGA